MESYGYDPLCDVDFLLEQSAAFMRLRWPADRASTCRSLRKLGSPTSDKHSGTAACLGEWGPDLLVPPRRGLGVEECLAGGLPQGRCRVGRVMGRRGGGGGDLIYGCWMPFQHISALQCCSGTSQHSLPNTAAQPSDCTCADLVSHCIAHLIVELLGGQGCHQGRVSPGQGCHQGSGAATRGGRAQTLRGCTVSVASGSAAADISSVKVAQPLRGCTVPMARCSPFCSQDLTMKLQHVLYYLDGAHASCVVSAT